MFSHGIFYVQTECSYRPASAPSDRPRQQQTEEARTALLIIDHTTTDFSALPGMAKDQAKQNLHIVMDTPRMVPR